MSKSIIFNIDFDGTCVDHRYPDVGPELPLAVKTLKALTEIQGHKLILWTMRSGVYLDHAVKWFKDNGIELWGVQRNPEQDSWTNSPKSYAHVTVDDSAYGAPLIRQAWMARPGFDWAKLYYEYVTKGDPV